jgi:hypothetical protein
MSANEEVRKGHSGGGFTGLGCSLFAIATVRLCTNFGSTCRDIENGDAPSAYPVPNSHRVFVSNANFGQGHRIGRGDALKI